MAEVVEMVEMAEVVEMANGGLACFVDRHCE